MKIKTNIKQAIIFFFNYFISVYKRNKRFRDLQKELEQLNRIPLLLLVVRSIKEVPNRTLI